MFTSYFDELGNEVDLEGESVQDIAEQLPEDYRGPRLVIRDDRGFVRGWARGQSDWRVA